MAPFRPFIALLLASASLVAADYGLDTRPAAASALGMPATPPVAVGAYEAVVAFPRLSFQSPVHICQAPRSNRLYVCEREGRIWSFENDASASTRTLVLDLNAPEHVDGSGNRRYCQGWDDCGLMSLAFHPEFGLAGSPHRGEFFIAYQASSVPPVKGLAVDNFRPLTISWSNEAPGNSDRVARFTIPDGSFVANHASEVVLIDQTDRHVWHNGGSLVFHPGDGFLYVTNGDEGKTDDVYQNTQRIRKNLFAGVMRIDVDGPRAGKSHAIPRQPTNGTTANYGIPDDNPFVGLANVMEEYWAIGLRSPHRMTYDQVGDRMLLGDIGAGLREEINLIVKGGNYQWAYKEGFLAYRSDRRPLPYTLQTATTNGGTQVLLTWTAPAADPTLNPGRLVVGDLIRFSTDTTTYEVTAATGYPLSSLTVTPPLVGSWPAGTEVIRTTGCRMMSVTSTVNPASANPQPNDVGTSTFTVDQTSPWFTVGACISFINDNDTYVGAATAVPPRPIDTYTITQVSGTSVTVRPKLATSVIANARIDRNTVLGDERPPLLDFSHNGTYGFNAIIGGHVYRGSRLFGLTGRYLFADNSRGTIWSCDPGAASPAGSVSQVCAMPTYTQFDANGYRGLSSFGVDANGEILICRMQVNGAACDSSSGQIWTIQHNSGAFSGTPIPTALSQTGAFSTVSTLTPVAGLIPYEVNEPLWSDGASKRRWIALPNPSGKTNGFDPASEQIGYADTGEWTFPVGTVFVKHFELVDNEQTNHVRRLETRLLVRQPGNGVYGVTYKWKSDNSDADLLDAGVDEVIPVTLADGSVVNRTWSYPGRADCLSCHNANAGFVLGVKTRQLNGPCSYPATGRSDNQLRTWSHIAMFAAPPAEADIPNLTRLRHEADTTASLEVRARSFIDANCAHCHRPSGVQALFDARFDTPLANQGLVGGTVGNLLGIAGAKVVFAGDPASSILYLRDNSTDPTIMMPPLAKHRTNDVAMTVVREWIESLATSVSIAGSAVTEGNAGSTPATLTVSIPLTRSFPVSVGWSTGGGTATAGSDYTATSGTAVIAAGTTSTTIAIPVIGDAAVEADETVTVTLTNPVNASIATASASLTIGNDDAAPAGGGASSGGGGGGGGCGVGGGLAALIGLFLLRLIRLRLR